MASYGHAKPMTYPGGGDNSGDLEDHANTDPALPGPRVRTPERDDSAGASLTEGLASRMEIHSVTPEEIGADTVGAGQVHMQHPKTPAGRGTRFG